MKISKYAIYSESLTICSTEMTYSIVYSTRTSKIKLYERDHWNLALNNKFDLIPTEEVKDMIDSEILVPISEIELETIIKRNKAFANDRKTLYMVIQPTAQCNLGCWYCGQSHENVKLGDIKVEHIVSQIEFLLNKNQYKHLNIGWFGGEPLLAIKQMKLVTSLLKRICHSKNIAYSSKIVTNGLTAKYNIIKDLIEILNLKNIEITIDGTKDYHNDNRYLKNGKGSFDIIYRNIKDIAEKLSKEVKLSIRCNVSERNYENVSYLIEKLASDSLQDKILFYTAPVHSWGNQAHKKSLSLEDFARLELQWMVQKESLGFPVNYLIGRKEEVCLTALPNSVVFDSYGKTYKCTEISFVESYVDSNQEKLFQISKKLTSKFQDKMDTIDLFYTNVKNNEYGCSNCRVFPLCGGSCPKGWMEDHPPCPPFKKNIEERILLHINKLIKQ